MLKRVIVIVVGKISEIVKVMVLSWLLVSRSVGVVSGAAGTREIEIAIHII